MNNIKTFDQLNEEIFGIGKNKNPYVDRIIEVIGDTETDVRAERVGDSTKLRLSISVEVDGKLLDICGNLDGMKKSVTINGKDSEFNIGEVSRVIDALKYNSKDVLYKKPSEIKMAVESINVVKFSDFKK